MNEPALDAFALLTETTGLTLNANHKLATCVLETQDFRRVRDLPRRTWQDAPDLDLLVERLSAYCRTEMQPLPGDPECAKHGCPGGPQTFRPIQAAALKDLYEQNGLYSTARVGAGKTLMALMSAHVLAPLYRAAGLQIRPLIIVPADLRKTTLDAAHHLVRHWKIYPFKLISYSQLSRDYGPEGKDVPAWITAAGKILSTYRPNLVVKDESDTVKNTGAGCTSRINEYLKAMRPLGCNPWHQNIRVVSLSGSPTGTSLREYWHIARWCLGPNTPMPLKLEDFKLWAGSLDESNTPEGKIRPGALYRLSPDLAEIKCPTCRTDYLITFTACPCCGRDKDDLIVARSAYRDRWISTPGVVSSREDRPMLEDGSGPLPLSITGVELVAAQPVREAIAHMRDTWTTPDGNPFETAVQLWGHCNEAQCGFYYVWDPRPPGDWLEAKRAWSKHLREKLSTSHKYRTPGQLVIALDAGTLRDPEGAALLAGWRALEPTFVPNSVPVWMDDSTLRAAATWLTAPAGTHGPEDTGPDSRLCWVQYRCVGRRLSEMTGIPYFSKGGCDPAGNLVDHHKGPAIVSINSCAKGRNLQYKWHQNLYTSPTSVAKRWEQSMGRTHRDGQRKRGGVTVSVYMLAAEAYAAMVYAIRRAQYIEQTTSQPQKLVYAIRDLGAIERLIDRRSDDMWKSEVGV